MIDTVVFDLGAVLIDWNPRYVYKNIFLTDDAMEHFLAHICSSEWNEMQDAGRSFDEATSLLIKQYPEYKSEITDYYGKWESMLAGSIEASVELLGDIKAATKYKIYALTNWSAESFPVALSKYEFLSWFDGILVSGEEKMKKPDPEIFKLLCNRFGIKPENSLFIDDNIKNINSARSLGFECVHFTDVENDVSNIRQMLF